MLNSCFSTVFTEEYEILGEMQNDKVNRPLNITSLTQEELWSCLKNIKIDKLPGLDGIHPRVLRELSNVIDHYLLYLRTL